MAKKLVVVESAAKAKTIEKFLGRRLQGTSPVSATSAICRRASSASTSSTTSSRLRRLAREEGRRQELKDEAKGAEAVYLATDPDREGEAIAWHLVDALGLERQAGPPDRVPRDHQGRDPGRGPAPARRSTSSASTRSRRGASSIGWSATRSARCSGRRSGAASRPGASSRSPCGWSSTASASSTPSSRSSTGRSRPTCASRCPARPSSAPRSSSRTARRSSGST